jgi:hypothetical protein
MHKVCGHAYRNAWRNSPTTILESDVWRDPWKSVHHSIPQATYVRPRDWHNVLLGITYRNDSLMMADRYGSFSSSAQVGAW